MPSTMCSGVTICASQIILQFFDSQVLPKDSIGPDIEGHLLLVPHYNNEMAF